MCAEAHRRGIRMKNRNRIIRFLSVVMLTAALTAGCAEQEPTQGGKDALQTDDAGGVDTTKLQGSPDGGGPDGLSNAGENNTDSENDVMNGTASKLGSLVEFSAETLDGAVFTQEDIQNKDVTVINFWALTCGPCIAEMPDLAAFEKSLPDNVQVVTVCFDGAWSKEETQELLEECGFEGVTLIAFEGDLYDLCRNIQYTPTTVVVDSEGNLIGDSIIGRQADLSGTYLEAVNTVLRAGGKDEISLEE